MNAGPEMLTLEQLGMYSAKFERGEINEESLTGQSAMHAQVVEHVLLSELPLPCRLWQRHLVLHFRVQP